MCFTDNDDDKDILIKGIDTSNILEWSIFLFFFEVTIINKIIYHESCVL